MAAQLSMTRSAQAFAIAGVWSALLLGGQLPQARCDRTTDDASGERPRVSRSEPTDPVAEKQWLSKLSDVMNGREPSHYSRSDRSVLRAFRATVQFPAKCMVRILCRGEQVALGTVVDSTGYIVTKGSELKGSVECEFSDGSRDKARLVGIDRQSDLALLKVAAHRLPAIRWSADDPPAVGGWVVTPGLSDVPQAIGIVSVAAHQVRGGVLGIQMMEDDPGPRVTFVVPGSAAATAGLTRGDIITEANDTPIKSSNDMVSTTSNMLPGDTVRLRIVRHLEEVEISAKLGSVSNTLLSQRARFQDQLGAPLSKRRFLFPSAVEHDSVLAPNQCGGVLLNLDGEAVGVNIARASRISSYAIPNDVAWPILKELRENDDQRATVPVAAEWSRD